MRVAREQSGILWLCNFPKGRLMECYKLAQKYNGKKFDDARVAKMLGNAAEVCGVRLTPAILHNWRMKYGGLEFRAWSKKTPTGRKIVNMEDGSKQNVAEQKHDVDTTEQKPKPNPVKPTLGVPRVARPDSFDLEMRTQIMLAIIGKWESVSPVNTERMFNDAMRQVYRGVDENDN